MDRRGFASLVLSGALASIVAGCVSCHTPPMDRRVTVAPDLGSAVWVTDVRMSRVGSQHCTLQANIVNNTGSVVRMEYKVVWLDSTGTQFDSVVSGWQPASAAARDVVGLVATAPSPDAVDFRLYVQAARR